MAAYQPEDEIILEYDDNEFHVIGTGLKTYIYDQADNNALIHSNSSDSSSSPTGTASALNDLGDISDENFRPADDSFLEDAFPDAVLGGSLLFDPLYDSTGENDTLATAPTDTEIDAISDTPPTTTISTIDVDEPVMEDVPEQTDLLSVPIPTQKQLMFVSFHPPQNPRRRYGREGKRRIKRIESSPMIINLSKLKKYKLNSNQLLILRLSLIMGNMDDNNPFDNVHIHPDKLNCFSGSLRLKVPDDGSKYIRIQQSDIDKGQMELKDLAIIKTKYTTYNFKLIPYDLSKISNTSRPYATNPNETTMANAQIFRQQYTLKASRIACQILIKEGQSLHHTHITCATHVMIEQEYKRKAKKPVKRAGKTNRKSGKKRRQTKKSK